jgi:hypothetical protein
VPSSELVMPLRVMTNSSMAVMAVAWTGIGRIIAAAIATAPHNR